MVVANVIPMERQVACESRDIECRSIPEKTFRDIAAEVGYTFASEASIESRYPDATASSLIGRHIVRPDAGRWPLNRTVQSSADVQDFLSRCDEDGAKFFSALFDAQKAAPTKTKITWNHESGFSMQFYFDRIGFVPVLWGFPARNRVGKSVRQRLDFPFDFTIRAGASEEFVCELEAALSLAFPLSGGRKRPSISVDALQSNDAIKIWEIVFTLASESATP